MKHIYAPHRSLYFETPKEKGCLFCRLLNSEKSGDRNNLIVHRGDLCFVMLNKYPYNNGHTMVVPYKHLSFINDIDQDTVKEVYLYLRILEKTFLEDYNAEGINMGLNIKEAAGAGVIDHLHYHILPRWKGDSNFMTCISDTRVVPEDFDVTFNKVKKGFANI